MASVTKDAATVAQLQVSGNSTSLEKQQRQEEDDAWKKNTDCVYFLASPLTCKKGLECEFRHSEAARLNPKDCYYWMNGACLNPKCPFRHPPLDALPEVPAAASGGLPLPSYPAFPSVQYGAANPGVPCIFFQKGYCLKGDRCPFVHGSYPASNKVPQAQPAPAPAGLPAPAKAYGALEKCTQQKIIPQANASRPVQAVPEVKPAANAAVALPRKEALSVIYAPPPSTRVVNVVNLNKETSATLSIETSGSKHNHFVQASSMEDSSLQNEKDADELLRESSPGFDVLVDDEEGEYYHNDDQFTRIGGNEGRNLNDLDLVHPDDYNPPVDPDSYRELHGYDSYDHMQDRYAQEQRRVSSERSLRETVRSDRRGPGEADLRSRLSKQRRSNGVDSDHASDRHAKERSYGSGRRDSYLSPPRERRRGSRLQGRIKLPVTSLLNDGTLATVRGSDRDRDRDHRRISPGGPRLSSRQGSLRDRLRGGIRDESNDGRNLWSTRIKEGTSNINGTNFMGPKSLAELKVAKQPNGKEEQVKRDQSAAVGKRRSSALEGSEPADAVLSFEGPKPLSEILKRKREAQASAWATTPIVSADNRDGRSAAVFYDQVKSPLSSAGEQEASLVAVPGKQENTSEGDEGTIADSNKKPKVNEGSPSLVNEGPSSLVNEEDVYENGDKEGLVEDGEEYLGNEGEEYEQADGEYEYEEDGEGYYAEDGEYYVEDGENAAELDGDYMDEDEADDSAKKIGVELS
ncbi:Zinc finger CCCH domain-containing protein [Drosera capensis]